MSDNVVKLHDRVPGIAVDNDCDLFAWGKEWMDGLASGKYGQFRSMVIVLETDDRQVATVSQSLGALDGNTLIGLLQRTIHKRIDGEANIADLREEPSGP